MGVSSRPKGVSPVFGNLFLPENLSLLAERTDRLRSDRARRLHTSAAWLAPDNNLRGRGYAVAEAFDKLDNFLQLFSRSEMSVFWPTKVGEEIVVAKKLASLTGAKHHAFRPPGTRDSTFWRQARADSPSDGVCRRTVSLLASEQPWTACSRGFCVDS